MSKDVYRSTKHWPSDDVGLSYTRLGDENTPEPVMVFVHSGVFLNLLFSSKVLLGCGFLKESANILERVKYRTTVKTASVATAMHAIQHSVGTRRLHFSFTVFTFVCSNKTFSFTCPSSESVLSSFLNGSYSPVFSDGAEKVTKLNK